MKKDILLLCLILVLTLVNGIGLAQDEEPLEVTHIAFYAGNRAESLTNEAFLKTIEEKGYNWEINRVQCSGDPQKLVKNIEDAVIKGVDVLYITYADLRASKSALQTADEAGIPIFTVDSGWTEPIAVDITSNNYVMSGKVSTYFVDRLQGEGNVVVFSDDSIHSCRKREDTFYAILEENPGINVLAKHTIDSTNFYADTQNAMEDFLNQFGNDIDAVWAPFDEAAMAVDDAIQGAGYDVDDMFVIGTDAHSMLLDRMRKDEKSPIVATVAQGCSAYGKKAVELIQEIVVEGTPVKEVAPTHTVYLRTPLITKHNIPEEGERAYLVPDYFTGD